MYMRIFILCQLFISSTLASSEFPSSGTLRPRIDFWKTVYTEVTSDQGLLHDQNDMSFYYKKIDLPQGRRNRIRLIRAEKKEIASLIRSILKKDFKNLTPEELRIVGLVEEKTAAKFRSLLRGMRFQTGLKDRYYRGLIRSYKYMDFIVATFKNYQLPEELVFLPHVESSFNYEAYSKVGAAGIWQFMRATARNFGLKVSYIIDERRDPLKATVAAAKLLKRNYEKLGSWPLALTAYNHGARSMQRAVAKLGTKDMATIIEKYDGRRFGFASKNFYATFMATVEISQNPERYFPTFKKPAKFEYSMIQLNKSFQIKHLTKSLEVTRKTLKEYNPSIRNIAYRTPLFLPKGIIIKVPKVSPEKVTQLQSQLDTLKIPKSDLALDKIHIVSRGESLFTISRLYRTEVSKIIQFNQITDPRLIYPGMKIKIPGKEAKVAVIVPPKLKEVVEKKPTKTEIAASEKALEKIVSPVEIKEVPRFKPKPKSYTQRFKDYFNSLFGKKESPKIIIADIPQPTSLLNLSSYDLDITVVSGDIYEISVETEETLGHLAEWAKAPTQLLRDMNGMGRSSSIQIGQKIKLRILPEHMENFKTERNEYHLSIQEDFYEKFSVEGEEKYTVKAGDTLTQILENYNLPYWLVRKSQSDQKLSPKLNIGDEIIIPKTLAKGDEPPTEALEN
ncbi:MAG: hypothetical protein CME65_03990 [Halobacteriovoraceae bacterium]|nr:hypothetical protein [Halobacteriovoraceae bacterium]